MFKPITEEEKNEIRNRYYKSIPPAYHNPLVLEATILSSELFTEELGLAMKDLMTNPETNINWEEWTTFIDDLMRPDGDDGLSDRSVSLMTNTSIEVMNYLGQLQVACGFAAATIVSGAMTKEDAIELYIKKGLPLALEMLKKGNK